MTNDREKSLEQIAEEWVENLRLDDERSQKLAKELDDSEQYWLHNLQTISQVAQMHQSQQVVTSTRQKPTNQTVLFQWGRLSVIEPIGAGAFGEVYRAHDELLDRDVALKLLKKELSSPIKSKAFIEEAQRLAKVRHPNVLAIHGANIHDSRAGFWADLIDGSSLDQWSKEQPLSEQILLKITEQITQGLSAIHHAGLIHGDIKPANLIEDERGDFLIMDFGAGMALHELEELSGYIHGTPALMAPELFRQQHAGQATDVYALGATLFKLATDHYPISGDDLVAIQAAHTKGQYLKLKSLRPDLSGDFCDLVQSMVAAEAAQRPDAESIIRSLYDIETAPQRRRNKLAVWSIIALLVIGTALSTYGFYQANQAKDVALKEQNKAQTVNAFLQDMLEASAELGGGRDVRVADVLDQASDKLWANPPEDWLIALEMHQSLAHSYNALRNTDKGIKHAEKSVLLATQLFQPHEEPYARSMLELMAAYENNKQHEESLALADELIEQAETQLGADHWYIQKARKFQITNLFGMAKYDEAIAILDEHFQQIPDPKTAVNNFGFEILQAKTNALQVKGQFAEAITAAEDAIAWLEAYPKGSLLNMEGVKTALGLAQLETGLIDEGVKTLEEVLALNEQIFGVENTEYVDALVNLGAAQRLQNKPEVAKETTMQAYDLAKKVYGDQDNVITIGIGTNLANMLVDLGDVAQGEAVMRESLDMAYQVLGLEKPQTLILEYNLAELLNNQSRYNEALEYAISTHSKKITTFGENHPYVFLSLDNWAISLRGMNRLDEAVAKHQQAKAGIVAAIGAKHPYALLVRGHQIDTLLAAKELVPQDERLNQLVVDLKEVQGADDTATMKYQQLLSELTSE